MDADSASAASAAGPDSPARVIAMLNQKGGVGKTTSTVNLGAAIAEAGHRVCMIDLDPQAHLSLHLGFDPEQSDASVYGLLVDPDLPASEVVRTIRPNLDLLPSEVDLAAAEVELAHHPQRQRILADKFAEIAGSYRFVLIDCPPSLGLLTLNALLLAREVFVPMQAHFLALQGVGKLLETVGLVCRSVNPQLRVSGIILCMHEGQTTLAKEVVADLEGFFERHRDQVVPWRNCRVLHPPIRRNIKLAEAPSFGQTIFDYAPWCPGAIDYRLLARRVIAESQLGRPETIETIETAETADTAAGAAGATDTAAPIDADPTDAPAEVAAPARPATTLEDKPAAEPSREDAATDDEPAAGAGDGATDGVAEADTADTADTAAAAHDDDGAPLPQIVTGLSARPGFQTTGTPSIRDDRREA